MAHLYAAYRCCMCWEIPDTGPLYVCPLKHRHCNECYKKLQRNYRGTVNNGGNCYVCKYCGKFQKSEVDAELLKKLKVKPPTRKPMQYIPKETSFECNYSQGDGVTKLPQVNLSPTNASKKPLRCPHKNCHKSVAMTSLVNHFKYEHLDVPRLTTDRGEQLCLVFDISPIEHDSTFCMAMVTVYEFNKIDILKSKSSQSVINTCTRLSGRIPLNTFWLMVSVSADHRKATSYVCFWLYSNTDEKYSCTIEVASKNEKVAVSSFCNAVSIHESCHVEDVVQNMNCLYVSRGSFLAILGEDEETDMKITIH